MHNIKPPDDYTSIYHYPRLSLSTVAWLLFLLMLFLLFLGVVEPGKVQAGALVGVFLFGALSGVIRSGEKK